MMDKNITKIKIVEQNIYNKDKNGCVTPGFAARPIHYSTKDESAIVAYCAEHSTVPAAYLDAAMRAISLAIRSLVLNGQSVRIANLGTFSTTCESISEVDPMKVGIEQVTKLKIRFLPCVELKRELENVKLELEGVYVLHTDENGDKYYHKVNRALSTLANQGGNSTPNSPAAPNQHMVTAVASPSAGGTVTGGGSYATGAQATLTAVASAGYVFSRWSDGNTLPTRSVTVNADVTFTAIFVATNAAGGGGGDEEE